jgi:hypothetical protein
LIVKFTSACKHFTSVPIAHAYPLRKDTVSKDSPGIDMKQLLFITVLCVGAGLGVARAADKTFTGEIMDSQCAQMGSHDMMMKGENAKNAKECAIACVKSGGKYALYDTAAKRAYQLDNQKKAAGYAGQKVTVTGTLDSDAIHVTNIQAGS